MSRNSFQNKPDSLLKLKKKDALTLLQSLADKCSQDSDISLKLTNNMPIGTGQANDRIDEHDKKGYVGIKDLADEKFALFDTRKPVPDKNFVSVVVSIFHEQRHLSLTNNKYERPDDVSRDDIDEAILASYIAIQNNGAYYDSVSQNIPFPSNRPNLPLEIDAERAGVINTYAYLCKTFCRDDNSVSEKDIEKLMLDYVNDRMQNSKYQIPSRKNPLKSMDEIEDAFDDAMIKSIDDNTDKLYCNRDYRLLSDKIKGKDEVAKFLYDNQNEYKQVIDQIICARGSKKDIMMASMVLYLHPEYYDKIPRLKDMDFSPKKVFGYSFPNEYKNRFKDDAMLYDNKEIDIEPYT